MEKLKQLTVEVGQLVDDHKITKNELKKWAYFCMKKKFPLRYAWEQVEDVCLESQGLQQIDAVVSKYIDDNDVTKKKFCRWVFPFIRQKFPPELLLTPLKIVYKRGNKLYVKDGIDKTDKNTIYGVQFPKGLMLSFLPYQRDCRGARDKAMSLRWGRKRGCLPMSEEFAEQTKDYEKAFVDTLHIVKPDVNIERYYDYAIWTSTLTSSETREYWGEYYSVEMKYYKLFCTDSGLYGFGERDWLDHSSHLQAVMF